MFNTVCGPQIMIQEKCYSVHVHEINGISGINGKDKAHKYGKDKNMNKTPGN